MNRINSMDVHGSLILGYAQACVNLHTSVSRYALKLLQDVKPYYWYPLSLWLQLGKIIIKNYYDPRPVLERVGIDMMTGWYHQGPGKELIQSGVDFIHFQTSSKGYQSVVKGPSSIIGDFKLVSIDRYKATIKSTTPFNRNIERGVLIGGIKAPGDIQLLDVKNTEDPNIFNIKFFM